MVHLPALITDLGLILVAAAVVILIVKKLKQPVVLGYLLAGLLVGRHVPFMPTVVETESIQVWAEIGVIFLLFGLGLEFSFKKLAAVGKSASTTALVEILFMLGIGFLVGQILGWSKMDSLFLGGILSISSTTIIVRAFKELGFKQQKFVSFVFGILIVEDLLAILLLVLLSTVAATQALSGMAMVESALKLGFFLILWFLVGIYLIPIFLHRVRKMLDDETTLVVSIGLCLAMVVIATQVGFSPALGAFVMGSILAETREGKRIEHLLLPVKDLFAAIFFVSVGMLIDPGVLLTHFWTILTITVVTILGKFVSSCLGSLISGKNLRQSFQTGFSLAQIGEFSFIIATLGLTLQVTSGFLYPIAVAVSALTTFTTPYLIKYSDPMYFWFEKRIPASVLRRLQMYEAAMSVKAEHSAVSLLLKGYGLKIVLNTVMVLAISVSISYYGMPWLLSKFPYASAVRFICCLSTLVFSSPFLWAILIGAPAHTKELSGEELVRINRLQLGLSWLRAILGFFIAALSVVQFYDVQSFAGALLVAVGLLGVLFSHHAEPLYRAIEEKFLENLNENERSQLKKPSEELLAPWDASLTEFVVSPDSKLVGKTLMAAGIKENFGVMVTMIERGSQKILAPGRAEVLYPFDRVYLIGTDTQLALARASIESESAGEEASETKASARLQTFGLEQVVLPEDSVYLQRNLRESGLREQVHGLVVGIERDGVRHLNPDAAIILRKGDVLWIMGERAQIKKLKKEASPRI
jgi:CPA2 family monovalent cation:H+ antiporter-2